MLYVVVFYLFFASLVTFIIAFRKIGRLEKKIRYYIQQFDILNQSREKEEPQIKPLIQNDVCFETTSSQAAEKEETIDEKETQYRTYSEPVFLKATTKEKGSFEKFFAGNVLNKVGSIALIMGIGFFLKYAFDNNWLNDFTQVLIGYLFSVGLLVGGNKIENKSNFSQALLGTGCAALYLTTYAGYSFYNIIPSSFAFILMVAITILSTSIAMNYNSLVIAFLGLIGGYITPMIMGSSGNVVGFLSYLVFLNVIAAFSFYKKNWSKVQSFAMFANFIVVFFTFINAMSQYREQIVITTLLVALIFALHFAVDIIKNISSSTCALNRVINPLLFYFMLSNIISNESTLGIVCVLLSIVCISTSLRKDYNGYKQNVILGLIIALRSVSAFTDGYTTIAYWILLSVAILLVGVKREQTYLLNTAVSFLVLIFTRLLFIQNGLFYENIETYVPLLSPRSLCFYLIITISFVSSYFLNKLKLNKDFAVTTLQFLGATALFTLLTAEINDYSRLLLARSGQARYGLITAYRDLSYIITWLLYSISFIKKSADIKLFKLFGYGAYIISLFMLLSNGFNELPSAIVILNLRVMTWLIAMGVTALIAKWNKNMRTVFTYIALFLGFFLIYSEIRIFLPEMSLKQLILSLSWLIYAIGLLSIGILKNTKVFRYFAIGTILLVILKIFLFDLAFLGQLHRIISFFGLGGILLFASYLYQKFANNIKEEA